MFIFDIIYSETVFEYKDEYLRMAKEVFGEQINEMLSLNFYSVEKRKVISKKFNIEKHHCQTW